MAWFKLSHFGGLNNSTQDEQRLIVSGKILSGEHVIIYFYGIFSSCLYCIKMLRESEITWLKGPHTIYFSSSLYIINQKHMIPTTYFHCITTWVTSSSG